MFILFFKIITVIKWA